MTPRLGSTIYYGEEWARKSHQDSAVRFATANRKSHRDSAVRFVTAKRGPERAQDSAIRFVTTKSWPEKATKTRQYDLLRPRAGQKKPPRLGNTTCYGQTWARKSHRRFVTAKSCPERTTKTRGNDLLRPRAGQKEPPRLGSTICYGQELARKSHQDSAVRFVTANRKSHRDSAVRFVTAKRGPERATKTRQYDLLRPNVAPRLGSAICRPRVGQREPPRLGSVTAKNWPGRATETRQCYLLRPTVWQERATKTRQYDMLRTNVFQKKPPRLGSTICYGQELARQSNQDPAVRFVMAKSWLERATKIRQHDLLRPRVGQKEPPRLGNTICYGQTWARKSHQDSAVRFVTAKSRLERATKIRQYDLLRPRVGQKEPPRLGSTICNGQELARKSH